VPRATARLGSLEGRRLVLLGAGEMGEGMADDLAASTDASTGEGPEVVVASRTRHRAVKVAAKVGAQVVDLDQLPAALVAADVLLSSTGSPTVVLGPSQLAGVMEARADRPLLIVDMGMPRDIDPAVRSLPGVTLLDLGDLQAFVEVGLDERRKEVGRVRSIVADEVVRFQDAMAERQAAPLVTALRDRAEELRLGELARHRKRLEGLDPEQQEAVAALTRSILAKLLHEPTVRLKESAGSARGERLAEAIQELFDL
jgi:glutamyl-tRNA reductase